MIIIIYFDCRGQLGQQENKMSYGVTERMFQDLAEEQEARNAQFRAQREAEEAAIWAAIAAEDAILCDGSGVQDERYIDVDQTEVTLCPGCSACQETPARVIFALTEFGPVTVKEAA